MTSYYIIKMATQHKVNILEAEIMEKWHKGDRGLAPIMHQKQKRPVAALSHPLVQLCGTWHYSSFYWLLPFYLNPPWKFPSLTHLGSTYVHNYVHTCTYIHVRMCRHTHGCTDTHLGFLLNIRSTRFRKSRLYLEGTGGYEPRMIFNTRLRMLPASNWTHRSTKVCVTETDIATYYVATFCTYKSEVVHCCTQHTKSTHTQTVHIQLQFNILHSMGAENMDASHTKHQTTRTAKINDHTHPSVHKHTNKLTACLSVVSSYSTHPKAQISLQREANEQ